MSVFSKSQVGVSPCTAGTDRRNQKPFVSQEKNEIEQIPDALISAFAHDRWKLLEGQDAECLVSWTRSIRCPAYGKHEAIWCSGGTRHHIAAGLNL